MKKKLVSEYDWRLQAITTLTADVISPYGTPMKKGEPVVLIHLLKVKGVEVNIITPNPTAMFLNLSNVSYAQSIKIFNFNELLNTDNFDEKDYFNSLEYYMASIIFAFTALETFANYSIPDLYEFKKLREDKKCFEIYDKEKIEKNINLDIKLGEILPEVLNIPSFKGNSLWAEYLELKRIRDRLIHLKTIDTEYHRTGDPYNHLWNDLINNGEIINYSIKAKKIIEYFLKNKKPRWLIECPF